MFTWSLVALLVAAVLLAILLGASLPLVALAIVRIYESCIGASRPPSPSTKERVRPDSPRRGQSFLLYRLGILWIGATTVGFFLNLLRYFAARFQELGWPVVLAHLVALGLLVVLVLATIALLLTVTREGRAALRETGQLCMRLPRQLWWYARRSTCRQDFRCADNASRKGGRVHTTGTLSIWTDGTDPIEEELVNVYERTIQAFTDAPLPSPPLPVRVLCFEHSDSAVAYLHAIASQSCPPVGYYMSTLGSRIVLTRATADLFPSTLASVAAHEFTHHLAKSALSRHLPMWAEEGLAERISSEVAGFCFEPGAWARQQRVAVGQGEQLDVCELLSATWAQLNQHLEQWHDLSHMSWVRAFYQQAYLIVRYLTECHGESWRSFLPHALRYQRAADHGFQQHFGLTPAAAWHQAQEHAIGTGPVAAPTAPSQEVARRIESELWPLLTSEAPASPLRRLAIRSLGAAGYAWGADRLINILDDPDDPLRQEAQSALECIAGARHGDDPKAWRNWLKTLDAAAVGSVASKQ